MANYWSKFSVAFSLPSGEAQDYAISLHKRLRAGEVVEGLNCEFGDDFNAGFECKPDGSDSPGIWLHQDDGESCGVESAITFIQHLLQKFIPPDQQDKWVVQMEWSNDCSRPRLDAFGGGAAIITAKEVKFFSTAQWLQEQRPNNLPLESGQERP